MANNDSYDDDWETEASYENNQTENEQRWGKDAVANRAGAIDMRKLIEETENADKEKKKLVLDTGITGSKGYGGKFGVEKDRMDKSAMGHEYIGKVEKHASQKDYSDGFGGKFGVQTDRVDKSAVGFDYKSQVEKHESQTDHKKGFGGKFGIETDRMDKSAVGFQAEVSKVGTNYAKTKPDISGAKPSNLRSKFENLALHTEEESKERSAQQKRLREEKDRIDREQATKEQSNTTSNEPAQNFQPQRSAVVTGRSDRISDVINVFNAPQPEEEKPAPKQPIKIPKAEPAAPVIVQTPDIISSVEPPKAFIQPKEIPPVEEFIPFKEVYAPVKEVQAPIQEELHANVEPSAATGNNGNGVTQAEEINQSEQELIEQLKSDTIEEVAEEQFILSPDEPGIVAHALYDYQAAADDEISFDPGDEITHIEMIDEGWWKGFHQATLTYGLFPSNYVQLKE